MNSPGQPSAQEGTTVTEPGAEVNVPQAVDGEPVPRLAGTWARLLEWGKGLSPARRALAAYLLYQALAVVIWAAPILPRFTRQHVGTGLGDSRYWQWALAWTPWAISHGMSPLHTNYLFPPSGVDLAWSAFVPGPALVAWPVTALLGPLTALNLLLVMAPALAGWACYLVCRRLTDRFWPSLVGGYLFGFSAYFAGNAVGFVNLMLIFPVPLLVYMVIRRVEGSLGSVAFVAGFAALLVALFSVSTEVFGTATVFGAIAFAGALAFGGRVRRRLLDTGVLMLLAGAIAAIALFPYLRDVVSHAPDQPLHRTDTASAADLWSFVVPPVDMRLGGHAFAPLLNRLTSHPILDGLGYVGIAVLVMLVGFGITERRRRSTWLLLVFVALVSLFVLGPVLHIAGKPHGSLPGKLFADAPLIQSALPSRFAAYSALAIGVIAAMWLSHAAGRWAWVRWAIVLAAAVSVFPSPPHHSVPQRVPGFLSSGQVEEVLQQGEVVYAIPGRRGDEMLWQATAGYWFRLAEGYIGPLPPGLETGPLAHGLQLHQWNHYRPPPQAFGEWIGAHGVTAIVLDERGRGQYESMLRGAGLQPVYSGGGVSVWRPVGLRVTPSEGATASSKGD
jgi:hypothetical protein